MKINRIKLAGFKSFVDPTSLTVPHSLTGIVGPNGCGKSNVIDAVLWVLGESSAKHLRGDAMSDVIFSGSNSRKPVGQASVEIIFDNSDGKIGGEYAGYNEVSIKRQLGRDGISLYFLNTNRCRRKDITNLFLGTGIGPRSYSVIEQGMISRVIESKPEELRIFLEEAAGISKYKERRRETENRIRHTKENLDRLSDIRDELEKQLNRLQRQASAAERYKQLKMDERQTHAELTALAWKDLTIQTGHHVKQTAQCQTEVEAAIARVRAVEAEIEKEHQRQIGANDQFNEIQGRFYGIGAEITRLEQAIQHTMERHQNLQRDKDRVERELSEIQQQARQDEQQQAETNKTLGDLEPQQAELVFREQQSSEKLAEAEQAIDTWQTEWNTFQQRQTEHVRNEHAEQSRITHLERSLNSTEQRIERLNSEKNGIAPEQFGLNLTELQSGLQDTDGLCITLEARRSEILQQIQIAREEEQHASAQLDHMRREYQTIKGRLASLEALQQSALRQNQQQVQEILFNAGLSNTPKLAQEVTVESGWETALEVVLAEHLDLLCVDDLAGFGQQIADLTEGVIGGIESNNIQHRSSELSNVAARLLDHVSSDLPLETLMPGVYVADSVDQAIAMRLQLLPYESFVTRQGDRVGTSWMRLNRAHKEEAGVLQREREIRDLIKQSASLETTIDQMHARLEDNRNRRATSESEAADLNQQLDLAQKNRATMGSELAAGQARLEQARSRISHIEQELVELVQNRESEAEEIELARETLSGLNLISEELKQQQEVLIRQRDEQNTSIQQLRTEWRKSREMSHELALKKEALRAKKTALEHSLQRYKLQQDQSQQRLEELLAALEEGHAPVLEMQQTLEQSLSKRLLVESELNSARESLQVVEQKLKQGEQNRQLHEQALQAAREKLEQARMAEQAVKLKLQSVVDQLREAGFEAEVLLQAMPEDVSEHAWLEKIESLERKITRLGPINLAAIDECKELAERKKYLDDQHADLTEAMNTLESAIRKIDKETRSRFKDVYDQVNIGFQAMFPRLFGGGEAHLELTGEDLLETGVAVIAKPPGKRNSSIHLLSGGEKALTAVALVFSIFQLNPAPFCLLDEVDAPLDDANVVRLCEMLKEMSEQVQFIFITHNKITMEIARQLIGVTMQEAGVSRLVSVDMDEAVGMVATG